MISRKPANTPKSILPEIRVEELINKGGSTAKVAPDNPKDGDEVSTFTLRVPRALLTQVDEAIKKSLLRKTRNFWILEAISAHLKAESEHHS